MSILDKWNKLKEQKKEKLREKNDNLRKQGKEVPKGNFDMPHYDSTIRVTKSITEKGLPLVSSGSEQDFEESKLDKYLEEKKREPKQKD